MTPTREQILEQLNSALAHPVFRRAPRMRALLSYLIDEELAGRGPRLTGYKVGVECLEKPDDFDPSTDASVRVEVGRLRRMLAQFYGESPDEPIRIEVPKGSYRPLFTPTDQVAEVLRSAPVVAPSSGPGVAVLRFSHDTSADDQVLLATGLREEVTSELFRYREFHFVDASGLPTLPEHELAEACARDLECEFMLSARLIAGARGYHLRLAVRDLQEQQIIWTRRFDIDREHLDVIECAAAIAAQTAHELARPTGVMGIAAVQRRLRTAPNTWTAADCILRWHLYRLRDRGPASHRDLRGRVRELVRQDPGFAMGYVMYALLKLDEVVYRLNPEAPDRQTLERAAFLVNQAIGTDPDLALAHYVQAQCHYFLKEFPDFHRAVDRTLTLHPRNVDLLQQCGTFLCFHGEWERGRQLLERADMRYHPGVGYRLAHLIVEYFSNEDPEPGRRLLETSYLPPTLSVAHVVACLIQVKCGNLERAGRLLRRANEIERGLHRDIATLVRLWFTDPALIDRTLADLQRLQGTSGVVTPLR